LDNERNLDPAKSDGRTPTQEGCKSIQARL